MRYYNSNSYFYPKVRTENVKIKYIVDYTPEEYKSKYQYRTIDGRPSDAFYFKPSHGNSREKHKINYNTYLYPGKNEIIKEIHKTKNEPYYFNESGIIREKRNYILYENKNWSENVKHPIVEYEKIELPPPPPKPKPKPKPKKIFEKSVEVIKEEIEREEDRKKKLYKSNFIRTKENNKNKKTLKYKNKKYYGEKRNYIKESDNIISIYDFKNVNNEIGTKNNILDYDDEDNETTKIKKLTEKKKINADNYTETLTSRKEYKLHKTSTVIAPLKK
jgi:hypothetical protein